MKPNQKAVTIGALSGLSIPGVVDTINYLWAFTGCDPLPEQTAIMVAGILSALLYRILPQSQRL